MESWTETYLREVEEHFKIKSFAIYIMKKLGLSWETEYWNYLVNKDLEKATTDTEKTVLCKMKR